MSVPSTALAGLLAGRKIIVSGGGGNGIGSAVVKLAAQAGAAVVAVDVDAGRLDPVVSELREQGLPVTACVADALSDAGIEAIMHCVAQCPGELHGLVTVVGGAPPPTWGPATRLSREHWHAQLQLNLDSMFFISQAVAAELQRAGRGGSIVAISSINGMTSSPYNVGYGAGKAAIRSVVETMALELATSGVRVNAVAPGPVMTPTANLSTDPQRLRRGIPMGRYGEPAEIAGPVLFLLSDLASFMTGQCLIADGGCNIKWCHLTDDNMPMFLKEESVRSAMNFERS
ncbi:SDR family NAD(P)-dependent oxidoreductase [Haliea sp. E17]|uniref:SDR family NAD(P)-dependent oxidoreductase n=1 Tax=Haliea sp. E17 TaxID=3401576 RepID=UPI003AAC62D9